jgi:hypothetical protein
LPWLEGKRFFSARFDYRGGAMGGYEANFH